MTEYNGWANYPTWNIHLWLTNEEGLYYQALEIVNQEYTYNVHRDDALKAYVEDLIYEHDLYPPSGMTADLLGWALAQVDWREITDALREE